MSESKSWDKALNAVITELAEVYRRDATAELFAAYRKVLEGKGFTSAQMEKGGEEYMGKPDNEFMPSPGQLMAYVRQVRRAMTPGLKFVRVVLLLPRFPWKVGDQIIMGEEVAKRLVDDELARYHDRRFDIGQIPEQLRGIV